MTTIEVLLLCGFNLLSLIIGVIIGQKSTKGREITLNPVKAIKTEIKSNRETKEQELKKKKIDTMLKNIDNYDGSGLGQNEIPRD